MNKILFVAPCPPFSTGGGSQATHAYLDAVLDIYGRKNVTVMVFQEAQIPDNYTDLDYIKIPCLSFFKHIHCFFTGFLSRMTKPLMLYMKNNRSKYSLCIINGGLTAGKAVQYINSLGVKTVVIHHNFEVEYQKDLRSPECLYGLYLGAVKKIERAAYVNAELNLFLTNQDVKLFEKAYGKSKHSSQVIGTFDYKDREVEDLKNNDKTYDITISGSLANYQTTIGLLDFYDNYLQIAKQLIPSLKVLLTGRAPSKKIIEIQKSDRETFTIVANPEKILSVVQQGKIYLCPICIGGGLKLRAMDGLKSGMPVLVHEVSSRGYDYFHNKPYFKIYNDECSFRKGLKDIIEYMEITKDYRHIINSAYYEFFGYENGVKRFIEVLDNLYSFSV